MKAGIYHTTKYYCAALVAVMVLASPGCDSNLIQCDTCPGNAIHTLGGTVATFTLKDSSDDDTRTYIMTVILPDLYLRWKAGTKDFGITSIFCMRTFWNTTFGGDWQPVVIWTGSDTPICGEIGSLEVTTVIGSLTADIKLKRDVAKTLGTTASFDSVVLALGRTCPVGACSGTFRYSQCFAPYAAVESNDNTTKPYKSLPGVDLNFASMSDAYLYQANLNGASLSGATLAGADLRAAELKHAALYGADLTGAILRGADLTGAVLNYANLTNADIDEVDLNGARVYQTIAPDGEVVDNATALLSHKLN
jgi:hypothetical protein